MSSVRINSREKVINVVHKKYEKSQCKSTSLVLLDTKANCMKKIKQSLWDQNH